MADRKAEAGPGRAHAGSGSLVMLLIVAILVVPASAVAAPRQALVGSMHEHSGYSDGWAGSRPSDYFKSAGGFGLDFMGSSEHAENLDSPNVFSEDCLSERLPECLLADDEQPENSFRKWAANKEQAEAATTDGFAGFRGFEWSSDRHGHLGVYFSRNYTRSYTDGGNASMETFWRWFTRSPQLGGGSDGLGVFNHPGAKRVSEADPGLNWNDFAHVPAADKRMVGLEVFNDHRDYGSSGGRNGEGWYARALDRGWHVGAIGAEDLGHRRSDDWGGPSWAKTVVVSEGRSPAAIRSALLARRFYAVADGKVRLSFNLAGQPMGSRLAPRRGGDLAVRARTNDPELRLELVTSGGRTVATGKGALKTSVRARTSERWYFVRARRGDAPVAYSSPIWVKAAPPPSSGRRWLSGDLHVHTCFSHDAYCPPNDDNTGPDEAYALGVTTQGRFEEASARGLDFLAVTDHNDVRSQRAPGFGSRGVIGVPGYEGSLKGHAQMLGATRVLDSGDASASAVARLAARLRAAGGSFQVNHPAYRIEKPFRSCRDTANLDWTYAYKVRPDTIEVWNPAGTSNKEAERYWECWLARGARVGATGGSDSHFALLSAAQGPGQPTTWVLTGDRSRRGVLKALREGRTTISSRPPGAGGGRLLLEADANRDGRFEAVIGDAVPPGSRMRVREAGASMGGTVQVRANGRTILDDRPLRPGGEIRFDAPKGRGWVRAVRRLGRGAPDEAACARAPGIEVGDPCRNDARVTGLTSPIYLVPAGRRR